MYVVLCNCPPDQARPLAKTLVEERLAACVNVIPGVTSFYVWDGALVEEGEDTLLIKVSKENHERLCERVRALHPYDTVEILALPVDAAASDADYVQWVRSIKTIGGDS